LKRKYFPNLHKVHSHWTIAAACISSWLDQCNSLLYGMLDTLLRKLQSMQNATAWLITGTGHCDHITPVLCELHRLPIRERIKFKVACLVQLSLSRQVLVYLADDCCLMSDSIQRSLQSADVQTCMVLRTYSSYGDKTFVATGPRSNCAMQTIPMDCFDDSWRDTFLGTMDTVLCDFGYVAP